MSSPAQGGVVITARVKNWSEFQHYRNRCPPWIKLQKSLLDDFEFARLPLASKALAPLLWLLASESMDGEVRIDPEWLSFRLRIAESDVVDGLTPLIDNGFLIPASGVLAPRLQDACLEGETEAEAEGEADAPTGANPPPKPKKAKTPERTFPAWVESIGDDDAIRADDPIFDWASKTGVPADWIGLAWWVFEGRYSDSPKKYADWRAVFRKAVREDWLKVWRMDSRDNRFVLTTTGELARREMEATA